MCIIYLPEVTSLLNFTAECVLSQLCSCFMGLNMSHTEKDSLESNMDLNQVEVTDVSRSFYLIQFVKVLEKYGSGAQFGRGG